MSYFVQAAEVAEDASWRSSKARRLPPKSFQERAGVWIVATDGTCFRSCMEKLLCVGTVEWAENMYTVRSGHAWLPPFQSKF